MLLFLLFSQIADKVAYDREVTNRVESPGDKSKQNKTNHSQSQSPTKSPTRYTTYSVCLPQNRQPKDKLSYPQTHHPNHVTSQSCGQKVVDFREVATYFGTISFGCNTSGCYCCVCCTHIHSRYTYMAVIHETTKKLQSVLYTAHATHRQTNRQADASTRITTCLLWDYYAN